MFGIVFDLIRILSDLAIRLQREHDITIVTLATRAGYARNE